MKNIKVSSKKSSLLSLTLYVILLFGVSIFMFLLYSKDFPEDEQNPLLSIDYQYNSNFYHQSEQVWKKFKLFLFGRSQISIHLNELSCFDAIFLGCFSLWFWGECYFWWVYLWSYVFLWLFVLMILYTMILLKNAEVRLLMSVIIMLKVAISLYLFWFGKWLYERVRMLEW